VFAKNNVDSVESVESVGDVEDVDEMGPREGIYLPRAS
jgi:hypothetical protein